jgi:hypothetical protein
MARMMEAAKAREREAQEKANEEGKRAGKKGKGRK